VEDQPGINDAAGNPFWFNGQQRLTLNPAGAISSSASSASPADLTTVVTWSTLPRAEAQGNPPRRKSGR
jgi:hypothetical protein